MKKSLKAGIIGLGRIASLYEKDKKAQKYYPYLTHAGTYTKHPKIDLLCGADIDKNKCDQFQKMWGVDKVYRDYRMMLSENKIDILSICTRPDAHCEIIKNVHEYVNVIFCEKPFCNNSREVKEVIKLCKKSGTKIVINLYREFDDSHNKVLEMIRSGKFGKIQRVNCYYGKGLRNMGTHLLGYLFKCLGSPKKTIVLNKYLFSGLKEYTYDVCFEFKGEVPCMVQSCDFNKFRIFEMDFILEKGRIQVLKEGLFIRIFCSRPNKAESDAYELLEGKSIKSTVGNAFYYAVEHLVGLSNDKKLKPIMSPKEYLSLQTVIEEIEKKGERI